MILADTSIWIDHFRRPDELLERLLKARLLQMHPFILGEIAMGSLADRDKTIAALLHLPASPVSDDFTVLSIIAQHSLFGSGLSYIDAHLLASVKQIPSTRLWTRDRRLLAAANGLSVAWDIT